MAVAIDEKRLKKVPFLTLGLWWNKYSFEFFFFSLHLFCPLCWNLLLWKFLYIFFPPLLFPKSLIKKAFSWNMMKILNSLASLKHPWLIHDSTRANRIVWYNSHVIHERRNQSETCPSLCELFSFPFFSFIAFLPSCLSYQLKEGAVIESYSAAWSELSSCGSKQVGNNCNWRLFLSDFLVFF